MLWIYCGIVVSTVLCIFNVNAQSLTCDNTTSACPGTEVTLCTCSITGVVLSWTVPGAGQLSFGNQDGVGAERSDGAYTAVITDDTGDRVSVLTYTATDALMNGDIQCEDLAGDSHPPATVTVTFAELSNPPNSITWIQESSTYNSASIEWTAPSDNGGPDITGYTITISPPPSSDSTCPFGSCNVPGDTLMFNITELDHTINYSVSVAAINCIGTGNSLLIDDLIDIVGEEPNSPQNVMISNMNDNNITVEWRCPSYNPLSPPVDNYTVTVNNKDPVSVVSDGSCSYTAAIAVSPQDAPYSVSVVATNDVGDSDTTVMDNIMSVQDVVTVIANSTFDTINFTFTGTVDDTTPVTITLSPNDGMGDGTIGGGVVISGLISDTPYTYTVSFEYDNIMYSTQSSVTTLVAPTTLITTSSTTTSATPTPTDEPTTSEPFSTTIIIIIVVVVVAVIALLLVTVLIVCICIKVKSRQSKGDDGVALRGEYRQKRDEPEAYVEKPVPETGQSGPMYQDPNTIERQQAPTGDFYAVPDRNKKSTVRRDPPAAPTELATYQDPSTIQHETAPTGDLYAIADKKQPGPKPDDRTYAALDFENGTGTASTSFQSRSRPQEVLYSEVQQ